MIVSQTSMFKHTGQKSLLQRTDDDNFSKKYLFNALLNSNLFLIILMSSLENSIQAFGILIKGWSDEDDNLENGMSNEFPFRRTSRDSRLLSSIVDHMLLNELGSKSFINLCINCKLKKSIREENGKMFSDLKIGSVWELYLEFEIILIAAFWRVSIFLSVLWEVEL
jgi:hypothetical protein